MTIRYARIEYSELRPMEGSENSELKATIVMEDGEIFPRTFEVGATVARIRSRDEIMKLIHENAENFAKRLTREGGKWFLDGMQINDY